MAITTLTEDARPTTWLDLEPRGAGSSERPRPSDPGGDEDVPTERESENGREDSSRESGPRGEPSRDPNG